MNLVSFLKYRNYLPVTCFSSPEKVWQQLHKRCPKLSLLITLGEEGSIAFTEEECVFREAVKAQAVDTTAAGDTYTGYFLAGILAGKSLKASMQEAGIAAAFAVTRPGAACSIPSREDLHI